MSNLILDISELPKKSLPILSDEEAGLRFRKWSFVNIYYLNALRDIYSLTKLIDDKSVKSITQKVNEYQVKKDLKKEWIPFTERHVLENLNALVKFGLLNYDYSIKKKCFENSKINSELSISDKNTLSHIFINYFRFKELSSWLINPSVEFHKEFEFLSKKEIVENSKPIYFFSSQENRFYDSFFFNTESPKNVYRIKDSGVMRFWDVYLKWGTELNIIEKYNLSSVNSKYQGISTVFFKKSFKEFDLIKFIKDNFDTRYVWIPELIFKITTNYRYPVKEIINFIIKNLLENDKLTYERTSEIFLIGGKTNKRKVIAKTYLFPIINDSYISTLILRK